MRVIDIISESKLFEKARGLLYRAAGDTFKNGQGQEISFVQVAWVPSQPGKYETYEELLVGLDQLKQNYPTVQLANQPSSRSRAFAVIEFQDVNNPTEKLYFVRFFDEIKHDMSGAWKNDGLPGQWQLQKASSLKNSYKLKPNDIITAGVPFAGVAGVLAELTNVGKLDPAMLQSMQSLAQGQLPVFPGMKEKESAIRDDLGETIAPCAITLGLVTEGGIHEAQRLLLNNGPWSDCTITFPKGKNAGLIDSYLNPPVGPAIGISSKGEDGAKASVSNVVSGLTAIKLQAKNGNPGSQQLLEQNAETVRLLDIIAKEGQKEGPIVLGLDSTMNFLTQSQADLIYYGIDNGIKDFNQLPGTPEDIKHILAISSHTGGGRRSVDIANPRYNVGYHIMAGLARQVAAHINKIPGFGNFCLVCINSSPLIQVHMATGVATVPDPQTGQPVEAVTITGFDTIYPPKFKGRIELVASKSYYATSIGGKLSFGFIPE
jgi:hypothetical protein